MPFSSSADPSWLLTFIIGKLVMSCLINLFLFRQVSLLHIFIIHVPIFISVALCYTCSLDKPMHVLTEHWTRLLLSLLPIGGVPAIVLLDYFRTQALDALALFFPRCRSVLNLSDRSSDLSGRTSEPFQIGAQVPSVPDEEALERSPDITSGAGATSTTQRLAWDLMSDRTIESAESGTAGILAYRICHGVAQDTIANASGKVSGASNTTDVLDADLSEPSSNPKASVDSNSKTSESSKMNIMLPGQPLEPCSQSNDSLNFSAASGPMIRGQILNWCRAAREFFAVQFLALSMEQRQSIEDCVANVVVQFERQSRDMYTADEEDYEFVRNFALQMDRSPERLVSWIVDAIDPERSAKTQTLARGVAFGLGNLLSYEIGSSGHLSAANPFLPPFDADRSSTASTVASSFEIY